MNRIRKMVTGLLMAALVVVGVGMMEKAEAFTSTETIALLVTPGTNMAVSISSPSGDGTSYDFTTVDLNSTSQSGKAAIVTNVGNVNAKWQLRGAVDALGASPWSLAASPALNQVTLQGLFYMNASSCPLEGSFEDGTTELGSTNQTANDTTFSSAGVFPSAGVPTTGATSRALWFRVKMPTGSSSGEQQRLRVYVVAVNP